MDAPLANTILESQKLKIIPLFPILYLEISTNLSDETYHPTKTLSVEILTHKVYRTHDILFRWFPGNTLTLMFASIDLEYVNWTNPGDHQISLSIIIDIRHRARIIAKFLDIN